MGKCRELVSDSSEAWLLAWMLLQTLAAAKAGQGGRPCKLALAQQLVMTVTGLEPGTT